VVQPGQFYRAARMSPATLAETIDRYGIKSILNLEGSRPEQRWYQDETALSNRLNVVHYDYRLSATRFVTSDQVDDLVAIIRKAPKPLLVHCKNGADRTGLISALYREKILGADKTDAYAQLSLKFGHFKYLESDSKRMDESYWAAVE
jgi:protein tyrosine/serine phosphatase